MIKVYFNNSCSLCRFEVNHYKKLPQEDIDWIDVTDNKLAEAILKKSKSDLIRRMHVSENGKIYTGADAFVKLWSKPAFVLVKTFDSVALTDSSSL